MPDSTNSWTRYRAAVRPLDDMCTDIFHDMLVHVRSMVERLAPNARVHYVVGNSKFYEWLVPVQEIFASLFLEAGLQDVRCRVIRKRNSKKELFEYLVTARNPR